MTHYLYTNYKHAPLWQQIMQIYIGLPEHKARTIADHAQKRFADGSHAQHRYVFATARSFLGLDIN